MARESESIRVQVIQYNIKDNNESLSNHIELFWQRSTNASAESFNAKI